MCGGGSGGNTSSRAHTRTCGARADRIYSRARRFPSVPSAKPSPHRTTSHLAATARAHTHTQPDRPTTTPVTSARLAPQPPIRLDAPRSATTFFFLSAASPVPRPKISRRVLPGPLFVSVPFFALFAVLYTRRVVWPPRSLRAYTKKQYRTPSMLNYRAVLFSFFLFVVIFVRVLFASSSFTLPLPLVLV